MLLRNLLVGNPEEIFLYLERRVNSKFPLSGPYTGVPACYRADLGAESYPLPFVNLEPGKVESFECLPDERVKSEIVSRNDVKFFVHPLMVPNYLDKELYDLLGFCGNFRVSSTSSTRTVMTRDKEKNFMIKFNLEKRLGERTRKLKRRQVEHSNKIMQELSTINLPEDFAYMPESFGVLYAKNGSEIGMIIREFQAMPHVEEKRFVLPLFSLYSLDKNNREHDPLLAQIVENASGKEYEFFHSRVLRPLISTWAYFVSERGISPDIHAQNCLLEINEEGIPTRVVYRDLQDFFINSQIREQKNLHMNFTRNIIGSSDSTPKRVNGELVKDKRECRKIGYSIRYDYTIGRILDYFAIVLSKFPSCPEERIIDGAKAVFKESFNGLEKEIFPKKAYYLKPEQKNMEEEFELEEVEPKYR